jgi:DNA-binding response OmpR family regulator
MTDTRTPVEYRPALDDAMGRFPATPGSARRQIRPSAEVPVVARGHRRDGADPRIGLELRVDDSLVRSVELHELLARVHAVLRQLDAGFTVPPSDSRHRHFRFCGWQLDCTTRLLTDPTGTPVRLTKGEYTLLLVFLNAAQRPLSREYLLQATHLHESVSDRSIDVQVLRLRRKLEPGPGAPRVIRTERGVGYLFAVPVQRS